MADYGEPQEITALRTNITSLTDTVTVGDNLQWFSNCLVEKAFVAQRAAQAILGGGATPAHKARQLIDGVFAVIRTSDRKSHRRMAASSRMSLSDVVAALDALTIEQTKELAVRFGVELKTVQDIENEYKGSSRKILTIQAWLDQDTQASWGKLVSGLQNIKMNSLAKQVASQHCLQSPGAASPSTDGHQPATVRSVATPAPLTPAAPSPPPPSTDPNQPTSPPPSDRYQPVAPPATAPAT
ncbi:hypothetical protein GBAR_LOCUS15577, partial [Geodia barretti]